MEQKRILVIDDEPHIRKVVSDVLKKNSSYTVQVAPDGEDAIAMLKENGYACDLIITDMMMPKVSGYEVVCHIQEACPRISCLVLTAHRNDQNVLKCLDGGAIDYLVKPLSAARLKETVHSILTRERKL